jgi:ribosome maturation factor RimP
MNQTELERILADRIAGLGFEFVELERTGSRTRPVLRIRIDRPDSAPGNGVTLEDCAAVSRALEAVLDNEQSIAERYILEVSSPGIERPLVRPRDYERFAGQEIAVRSRVALEGLGKRIEGKLIGLTGEGPDSRIKVALEDGRTVDIPHADVVRAHLVFRWDEGR